jgi:hypothetical protein
MEVTDAMDGDYTSPVTKEAFEKIAKNDERAKKIGFETFKRMIDNYDVREELTDEENATMNAYAEENNDPYEEIDSYLSSQGIAKSYAERLGNDLRKKGDYSASTLEQGVRSLKNSKKISEEEARKLLTDFRDEYNKRHPEGLEAANKKAEAKAQKAQEEAQKSERKKKKKAETEEQAAFNRLMAEDAREQRNAQKNKNQKLNYYFDSRGRLIDAATGKPVKNVKRTNLNEQSTEQAPVETFNPTANETTAEEKKNENVEERKTEENKVEEKKEETPKEETAEQQKVEYPLTEPSPTELAETLKSENSDDKIARILDEIDNPKAERTGNDEELNSVLAIAYYRLGASVEHANALADRKMSTGNSRTRYAPVMEDIMKEQGLTAPEARKLISNIHSRYNDMVKTAKSQRNKQGFTRQQTQNVETENVMDAETNVRQQAKESANTGTLEQAMVSEPQNVAENKTEEPIKQEAKQTSEMLRQRQKTSKAKQF